MEQSQQTGTNDKNPQFKDKNQNQPPLTTQRAHSSDHVNDIRQTVRASSLPTNNIYGLKKNDTGLAQEDRLMNVSNLMRNQTAPRDLNLGERSRVNTYSDLNGQNVGPNLRRFTEDTSRSRIGDLGKRSILELQQSLINPHFRRMTSRMISQAKINAFKTVKSQRVYPESLIYKIKKITMTRKLDPEVGKIKLRIDEFGNQDLNKFAIQQVPGTKNVVDIPSSISSYNTIGRSPSKNNLNSLVSRSNKTERMPGSTNKQDSRSLYTNLLSPTNPLGAEDSSKLNFADDPEISPRVRINETVDEHNHRSTTFGINPVPVIPLKPKLGLTVPTNTSRASHSQDKRMTQPNRTASAEKEETLIVQKPSNGTSVEGRLNAFRKTLKNQEVNQNNMRSLVESKDYPNVDMTRSANQNQEQLLTPTNRIVPKSKGEQKSFLLNESNPIVKTDMSQSEVIPLSAQPNNHKSNNQTINELIANENNPMENLLVSTAGESPADRKELDTALNESNNTPREHSNIESKEGSENINDGEIEDEENDVVPKIDFLKKFKGKDEFSTIHETEEENRSISSKFGTELQFGAKGLGNYDRPFSMANQHRPSKVSKKKRNSIPITIDFNSGSGYGSSTKNVINEVQKYGTEVQNDSESDTNYVAHRTIIPISNTNPKLAPRFSDPSNNIRNQFNFNNGQIAIDTLQIESSTEKTDNSQSYLANDSRIGGPKPDSEDLEKGDHQNTGQLEAKPTKYDDLKESEITLHTNKFEGDDDHEFHTNNDLDAYFDGIHESAKRRNEDSLPTVTDQHQQSHQADDSLKQSVPKNKGNNGQSQLESNDNYNSQVSQPQRPTLTIPTIEPAEVIDLQVTEKCKDVEYIPSVSPEAIWSVKLDSEMLKQIVPNHFLAPIQVFHFREERNENDNLRPVVTNITVPPTEVSVITVPNESIQIQGPNVNQSPNNQTNNQNQIAVPPAQDIKDGQPRLNLNSDSKVLPARSVDINLQSQKDKSTDFKPPSFVNSRREVRDDLTPVGSQRRQPALKNPRTSKRFEIQPSLEPKKITGLENSLDGSKMSYDSQALSKDNIQSLRSNKQEEDSKRVAWAVGNSNFTRQQPQKGQRTRIDFPEPSVNETTVQSQKISQKFVKFQEAPEVEESYESLSYRSLEASLIQPHKSMDDEMTSLANTSLIKLDNEQLQTLSKRDNNALDIYVNTLKDRKKIHNAKVLGSVCCIFFFLSSVLWIVLLKILHDKNSFLSNIIMYPPTLGLYHQVYNQFFFNYDKNFEVFQNANKNLNQQIFPSYHKKIQSLKVISELKLDNSVAMLGIKKYIADMVNELPSQKALKKSAEPRNLALGSSTPTSKTVYKTDLLPSAAITRILRRLEAMKDQMKNHQFSRIEMEEYLQEIQIQSEEMYQRCLELIDNFGRYFIMTNRIWVTSENIFRFYQSKAKEVVDEMTIEHYRRHKHARKNIRLPSLHYKTWARLLDFPIIKISSDRKILMLCSIRVEINDLELKYTGQAFDLYLENDNSSQSAKRNFEHQIDREKFSVTIVQMIHVPPGIHDVELYAMISGSEIVFSNLEVDCVEHLEYQNIPEYHK